MNTTADTAPGLQRRRLLQSIRVCHHHCHLHHHTNNPSGAENSACSPPPEGHQPPHRRPPTSNQPLLTRRGALSLQRAFNGTDQCPGSVSKEVEERGNKSEIQHRDDEAIYRDERGKGKGKERGDDARGVQWAY